VSFKEIDARKSFHTSLQTVMRVLRGWLIRSDENPCRRRLHHPPPAAEIPPRPKRSGLYTCPKPMSISCGYLFSQCY